MAGLQHSGHGRRKSPEDSSEDPGQSCEFISLCDYVTLYDSPNVFMSDVVFLGSTSLLDYPLTIVGCKVQTYYKRDYLLALSASHYQSVST